MAQQRYHVIERIDAGGMAEVFKANSTSLQGFQKLVAIKRILPNLTKNERFVRMFLDEAKVSLHLNHTNCVQVFDLGLADGTYFIVMEYVDGVNLKNIIEESQRRGTTLPVEQTVYVAFEICKGLAHAHDKRDQEANHLAIVHRDISPPNILISREGEVKITDFGLAKAKSQVETTDPGIVKGKFGYLSPEAAHGEEVDARTDIFAVGILMWEMLTGERLFLGETDLETLKQVRAAKVPPLKNYRDDIPNDIEQVILKALAPNPKRRYQSVRDMGRELTSFLFEYGEPVSAFDIAEWVESVVEFQKAKGERTDRDKAVEEAVQQAVNQIVSLEEIEDLDLYLAQTYDQMEDQGEFDPNATDFEDPRMWADLSADDMGELGVRDPGDGGDDEDWQERNLEELLRRKSQVGGDPHAELGEDPTMEMQDAAHLQDLIQTIDARHKDTSATEKGGGEERPDASPPSKTSQDAAPKRPPPSKSPEEVRKEEAERRRILEERKRQAREQHAKERAKEQAELQARQGEKAQHQQQQKRQQRSQKNQQDLGQMPIQPGAPKRSTSTGAGGPPAESRRDHVRQDATEEIAERSKDKKGGSSGLLLVIFIVLLAIIAGGAYVLLMG